MGWKNTCLLLFLVATAQAQELKIGTQTWAEKNLTVATFKNGDAILQAQTKEEWIEAIHQGKPAWCFSENSDGSIDKDKGKLYNLTAIRDPRGLAPDGWKIPTRDDFKKLIDYYGGMEPEIQPTDIKHYKKQFRKLRRRFKRSKKDSLFEAEHDSYFSDGSSHEIIVPNDASKIILHKNKLDNHQIQKIEQSKVGQVLAPVIDGDVISLIKVVDFRKVNFASVRHILLRITEEVDPEVIQKRADSLIQVIQLQDIFEEMVELFSEDPGSVNRGGVYEDFTPGTMVKPFDEFCFSHEVGALGSVRTAFGIHLIEVMERYEETRPIVVRISQEMRSGTSAAMRMKDHKQWNNFPEHGMTTNSFSAIPTGFRMTDGSYLQTNEQTVFWTSSEYEKGYQILVTVAEDHDKVLMDATDQAFGFSVRCIKDN